MRYNTDTFETHKRLVLSVPGLVQACIAETSDSARGLIDNLWVYEHGRLAKLVDSCVIRLTLTANGVKNPVNLQPEPRKNLMQQVDSGEMQNLTKKLCRLMPYAL